MIRVLVVDDDRMVCAHLRTILGAAPDIEVVGEAYDGAEAVEAVVRLRPDVVLMDLRMPDVDGLAAIERIAGFTAPPRMVALTTFDADEYVLRALQAGAVGFLLKSTPPEDLVALVRVGNAGHTVLSPEAAQRLVGAQDWQRARERVGALTSANSRCWRSSAPAGPTCRSPGGCTSPRPPSRATCRGCWSSSTATTAPRRGCSPTRPGSGRRTRRPATSIATPAGSAARARPARCGGFWPP